MIIKAKEATHSHCLECDAELPLMAYAFNYNPDDCEDCDGPCEYLQISTKPIAVPTWEIGEGLPEVDHDAYVRDRTRFGGRKEYVYTVNGEHL